MFLGHYALAFGAKRVAPATSLGAAFLAAQLLDELWPLLILAGVEHVRVVPGLMAASPVGVRLVSHLAQPADRRRLGAADGTGLVCIAARRAWRSCAAGTPPSDERAVALGALVLWLLVPWGWWVDRHREPVAAA